MGRYNVLNASGEVVNTIVSDENFVEFLRNTGKNGYTYEAVIAEPQPDPEPSLDDITALQLAVAELAEAQVADQTANELAFAELAEIVLGG